MKISVVVDSLQDSIERLLAAQGGDSVAIVTLCSALLQRTPQWTILPHSDFRWKECASLVAGEMSLLDVGADRVEHRVLEHRVLEHRVLEHRVTLWVASQQTIQKESPWG